MRAATLPHTKRTRRANMLVQDEGSARQAAAFGAQHKLCGADAVYLAAAAIFTADLVTLDREQLERGATIVQTLTPADFLATIK